MNPRRLLERLIPGSAGVRMKTVRRAQAAFDGALKGLGGSMRKATLFTGLATLLQLAIPWPLQIVLDHVLAPIARGEASQRHAVFLAGASLAAALLPIMSARATFAAKVMSAEIGKTATLRIRRRLFDHINRLSVDFHTESRTGDLLVRLTGDVHLLRDLLFTSWLNLLDRGMYFIGLAIALMLVDWRLGLLALGPLPFLSHVVRSSGRELRSVVRSQRKREGNAAAYAGESLSQIRVVKAYSAEATASDRFASVAKRGERAGAKAAKLAAGLELSAQQVSAIGGALVLFAGAVLVILGQLTAGVLLVAVAYTKSLYRPLRKMSNEAARLSKATAVTERILEVFEKEPEAHGIGVPITSPLRGEISGRGLGYAYPGGHPVFDHIDFAIPASALAVLEGPNGSGKSTLLSLILRFADPTSGELRVDDRPVQHYRLDDFRRRIAYVPQQVLLFSGTLRENILLGNPGATEADVQAAVRAAQLQPVVRRLPDGLDTEMGEGGETLSGGEARRVMLARAAVRNADILLLDEPFEGIDAASRPLVAQSIRTIAQGTTTIVVSHVGIEDLRPDVRLSMGASPVATGGINGVPVRTWDTLFPRRKGLWPGFSAGQAIRYDPLTADVHPVEPLEDPELPQLAQWLRLGELVAYRPGVRATVRVNVGPQRWFVKVAEPRRLAKVVAAEQLVHSTAADIEIPRRLLTLSDAVVHGAADGEPLHETLFEAIPEGSLAACGAMLARLHSARLPDAVPTATPYSLEEWANWAIEHDPVCPTEIVAGALSLDASLPTIPEPGVLIHGDLHDKNVFVAKGAASMIDLASVRVGRPSEDMGMLAGHLVLRALQRDDSVERATQTFRTIMEAYEAAGGPSSAEAVQIEAARTLARLACLYRFRAGGGDITPALLDAAMIAAA